MLVRDEAYRTDMGDTFWESSTDVFDTSGKSEFYLIDLLSLFALK